MYHTLRLQKQLQELLQEAITLQMPQLGFIQISAVVVTADQKKADVLVITPTDESINQLTGKRMALRDALRGKIQMRHLPYLHFIRDTQTPKIDQLLEEVR